MNGSKQVAAWGKDRMLRIWDSESGEAVRKVTLGKDWKLDPTTIALSSDGRRLLTSHEDDSVHLRESVQRCRTLPIHQYPQIQRPGFFSRQALRRLWQFSCRRVSSALARVSFEMSVSDPCKL